MDHGLLTLVIQTLRTQDKSTAVHELSDVSWIIPVLMNS
jgi:hypothetical protein